MKRTQSCFRDFEDSGTGLRERHSAGRVVLLWGSCFRQQSVAAPSILPAVLGELLQVLSLLFFPPFLNGLMMAVSTGKAMRTYLVPFRSMLPLLQFGFSRIIKSCSPRRQLSFSPTEGPFRVKDCMAYLQDAGASVLKRKMGRWRLKRLQFVLRKKKGTSWWVRSSARWTKLREGEPLFASCPFPGKWGRI